MKTPPDKSLLPPLPPQFSAEIVRSDGDRTKVYLDGSMRRIEMYFQAGQSNIIITRPDKGLMWSLEPEAKTYSQSRLPKGLDRLLDPDTLCEWTLDGTAVIDGHQCRRFVGRYRGQTGPIGEAYELCFVDVKTQMRRRMVTFDLKGKRALTIDYLNSVVGPPPRAVFELPEGYKRGYHRRKKY